MTLHETVSSCQDGVERLFKKLALLEERMDHVIQDLQVLKNEVLPPTIDPGPKINPIYPERDRAGRP